MIYFDNAATSFPKPPLVPEAVLKCLTGYAANPGRSGHDLALQAGREIFEVREKIAGFFNIKDSMQIVFTSNATDALNIGLHGFLSAGDRVLTTSMEHNSVLRPLTALSQKGVIHEIIWGNQQGQIDLETLAKALQAGYKLFVVNHASNVCGSVAPLHEIGRLCREAGVTLMVDGSQSAGVLPLDVEADNIDLLAVAGHKSLYGPQGTGFLYIRPGLKLIPYRQGGTGSLSEETKQPEIMPDCFESGTVNTPGIAGLGAGLDFVLKQTPKKILQHELALSDALWYGLKELSKIKLFGQEPGCQRTAVVSFTVDGMDSGEVGFILNQNGICTRPGLHCAPLAHKTIGSFETGTVRLSPGYFNTLAEVETILRVISQLK